MTRLLFPPQEYRIVDLNNLLAEICLQKLFGEHLQHNGPNSKKILFAINNLASFNQTNLGLDITE